MTVLIISLRSLSYYTSLFEKRFHKNWTNIGPKISLLSFFGVIHLLYTDLLNHEEEIKNHFLCWIICSEGIKEPLPLLYGKISLNPLINLDGPLFLHSKYIHSNNKLLFSGFNIKSY